MIQRATQFSKIHKFESPAMAEIRRCFQRPIFSSVVVSSDLNCVLGISKSLQTALAFVFAMTNRESAGVGSLNVKLAEPALVAQDSRQRLFDRHCAIRPDNARSIPPRAQEIVYLRRRRLSICRSRHQAFRRCVFAHLSSER